MSEKKYGGLDIFKFIASFLVIAVHTSPLLKINSELDFILTHIIARIAVPFFVMTTGYFVMKPFFKSEDGNKKKFAATLKKYIRLYFIAVCIYTPVNIYAGQFTELDLLSLMQMFLIDGTFYHLWYFPALIFGCGFIYLLKQKFSNSIVLIISIILYIVGLFGDSYYGVIESLPLIKNAYDIGFLVFAYTRNGLFYIPLFLVIGAMIKQVSLKRMKSLIIGFIMMMIFMIVEGLVLSHNNYPRHDSMYLCLVPCIIFLFLFLLNCRVKESIVFRQVAMFNYILHPLVIIFLRGILKIVGASYLIYDNLIFYIFVCVVTTFVSYGLTCFRMKPSHDKKYRAWIELDRHALKHNVDVIKTFLPSTCQIMAVVKANAYGHGADVICKELNAINIKLFAVATLNEGIELRKNRIKGDILILGYTSIRDIYLVRKYHLIQTVVDYEYAVQLNQQNNTLNVHLAIDTGMHRLGISADEFKLVEAVLKMPRLTVKGIFTHLCACDSFDEKSVDYTNKQIDKFYGCITYLREKNIPIPQLHLQSTYGIFNYPDIEANIARAGNALFGLLSKDEKDLLDRINLKPVLSLKARIAIIREIKKGEKVGYGMQYKAEHDMKIAVITIGYADGLSSKLANSGSVLVHGQKVPIIGRMCMDQTTIDVSEIEDIQINDVITIIGKEGVHEITAYDVARQTDKSTNEAMSQLGKRLDRIIV